MLGSERPTWAGVVRPEAEFLVRRAQGFLQLRAALLVCKAKPTATPRGRGGEEPTASRGEGSQPPARGGSSPRFYLDPGCCQTPALPENAAPLSLKIHDFFSFGHTLRVLEPKVTSFRTETLVLPRIWVGFGWDLGSGASTAPQTPSPAPALQVLSTPQRSVFPWHPQPCAFIALSPCPTAPGQLGARNLRPTGGVLGLEIQPGVNRAAGGLSELIYTSRAPARTGSTSSPLPFLNNKSFKSF